MGNSKLVAAATLTIASTLLMIFFSGLCRGQAGTEDGGYISGHVCSTNVQNFTLNSTYHSNLLSLLRTLSSAKPTGDTGFFNSTAGDDDPYKAYGSFLCRGDISPGDCAACVRGVTGTALAAGRCPTEKQAVFQESECYVRYSDRNYFSKMATSPYGMAWLDANVTDPGRLKSALTASLRTASAKAANGTMGAKKYATIKAAMENSTNVAYSLVQCMPDLTGKQCRDCLQGAVAQLLDHTDGAWGAALFYPSCSVRYEMYEFFDYDVAADADPEDNSTATHSTSSSGRRGLESHVVVIAVVSSVSAFAIVLLFGLVIFLRRQGQVYNSRISQIEEAAGMDWTQATTLDSLQYSLALIQTATNNFSANKLLGRGGFGEVYKGELPNGEEVAVKRLSKSSIQGAVEFKNEVHLLARLQHRNLVRLLGFCLEGDEHILIYEYVPNQSLDCFLFNPEKQAQLGWSKRYSLITGIARGMLYLHEDSRLRIIHRDLKASNILLDKDMNPKISDFGIAKLADHQITHGTTSRVVGTFGYIPPEYMMHGHYSVRSDVYSFGVVILEAISGKKNNNFNDWDGGAENLMSYAWKHWTNGDPLELLDPIMRDSYCREEVMRCIQIGLLCVEEDPINRPTMATLVLMLTSLSVELPPPNKPAFSVANRPTASLLIPEIEEFNQPPNLSQSLSINEASITDLYPR